MKENDMSIVKDRIAHFTVIVLLMVWAAFVQDYYQAASGPAAVQAAQTYTDNVYDPSIVASTSLQAMEDNFAALKSCFSGSSSPANPVAGMWWYDTTANILKLRNEANSAWLDVYDFANQGVPLAINCSRTVVGGTGITATGSLNGGNVTVGIAPGGVGATQLASGGISVEKLAEYQAGNALLIKEDSEGSSNSLSPIKVREFQLDKGGTLRIKFDIASPGPAITSYGRIYRNGTAVGILRSVAPGAGWATYSQDISGWEPGDLVQLYVHGTGITAETKSGLFRNVRIGTSNTWPVLRCGSLTI